MTTAMDYTVEIARAVVREQQDYSNKTSLPSSVLAALDDLASRNQATLPYPLTFELTNPRSERRTYCGVRDFTAAEGSIEISRFLEEQILLETGDRVRLKLVDLPKGTRVVFQPLSADFDIQADIRALLESQLRLNYTTLVKDEVITITGDGGLPLQLKIAQLVPSDHVSIIDTDLETDIQPMDDIMAKDVVDRRQASLLQAIQLDTSVIGDISVDATFVLRLWDRGSPLLIRWSGSEVEAHISTDIRPRRGFAPWSDVSMKEEHTLELSSSTLELQGVAEIYILLHSPTVNPRPFKLEASQKRQQLIQDDTQLCENCGQPVPVQSYNMHLAFCFRHNKKCPQCAIVLRKNDPGWESHWHCPECDDFTLHDSPEVRERHVAAMHAAHTCVCGQSFPNLPSLSRHRSLDCPQRLAMCRFCKLYLPVSSTTSSLPTVQGNDLLMGLTPHEAECGSRTTECDICKKILRLKDMGIHQRMHDGQRLRRTVPNICRNSNCVHLVDLSNSLGLCSVCFGPLWVADHDPTGAKLRVRLERRLIKQLLNGCGRTWCHNKVRRNISPACSNILDMRYIKRTEVGL